jgi:Domain of unknown function (DUF6249)
MNDELVSALAVVCIFGLPMIAWISIRGMQHRERMEMIKHGVVPPAFSKGWSMPQAPQAPQAQSMRQASCEDPQGMLRKGIVVVAVGVALTIGLSFIGTLVDPPRYTYGPWLLGGLIPLFVGLAQVVIALMSGASIGAPGGDPYAQYRAQGTQGPQGPAAPPPFDQSYTYRPGPAQELQRPVQPPDRR